MTKNSFRPLTTRGVGVVVMGLLAGIGVAHSQGVTGGLGSNGPYTTANNPSHCVITLPRPMMPGPGGERGSITWQDDAGRDTGGWPRGLMGCVIKEPKP